MTSEKLRECSRRQSRAVLLFCIVQCWLNKWDGIVIRRDILGQFFNLERLRNSRLYWISEDLKEFFPYHNKSFRSYFDSVKISRIPFEQNPIIGDFKAWKTPSNEYILKYYEQLQPLFTDTAKFDMRLLGLYLSWLSQK